VLIRVLRRASCLSQSQFHSLPRLGCKPHRLTLILRDYLLELFVWGSDSVTSTESDLEPNSLRAAR
jgi:hypothetical protein